MQPGREDRKKAFFEGSLIFGTAGTLSPPSSNLATILAVIAFALPLRPFFFTYAKNIESFFFADAKNIEPLLIELAVNFAVWVAVVLSYKYVSKRSLKQWWIFFSGSLSWFSFLTVFSIINSEKLTKGIWLLAERHEPLKEIILFFPSACAIITLIFAVWAKGTKKYLFYVTSASIMLVAASPVSWIIVYILFSGFIRH